MTRVKNFKQFAYNRYLLALLLLSLISPSTRAEESEPAWSDLTEVRIKSSADGTEQPSLYMVPKSVGKKPAPLLVVLHSWSGDYHQENIAWLKEAVSRGWLFIHPNFRGQNDTPEACGSRLARQDIIDAVDWMIENHAVDEQRIYLGGTSGGGHMTMLMAGHFPHRFSAASAWVGISDIAEWYRFHVKDGEPDKYGNDILKALGQPPGVSKEVDAEYRDRSPIFHIHHAVGLPLDISAGVTDGHTGSVPIHHSLLAFNALAKQQKLPVVSEQEMDELWTNQKLSNPGKTDMGIDPEYEREIFLRRIAGQCRVTIFDGGHEGLPRAACEWLSRQKRETKRD